MMDADALQIDDEEVSLSNSSFGSDDTSDDDDEFTHRQIYDDIASIKTMYPVLLQMIDSNPDTRITIPDIISACTPKPEVHSK